MQFDLKGPTLNGTSATTSSQQYVFSAQTVWVKLVKQFRAI